MLLAGLAALAGAAVQSATGFGFALVLSPVLFATLDPHEAVSVLLVLALALNVLVLADGGPGPVRWRALAPLLGAALPGLALGVGVLELVSKPALQVLVGAAVIAAAAVQLRRPPRRSGGERGEGGKRPASGLSSVGAGLVAGTLTTSISVNGPPLVLWLEARGLTPAELRASLAAAFFALDLVGLAAVLASGGAEAVRASLLLPLLGLVLVGHVAGAFVFRRISGPRFFTIVLALVVMAGLASLAAGLSGV